MTAIQQHIAPNTMVAVRPVGARGAFHVHVTKEHIDVPANATRANGLYIGEMQCAECRVFVYRGYEIIASVHALRETPEPTVESQMDYERMEREYNADYADYEAEQHRAAYMAEMESEIAAERHAEQWNDRYGAYDDDPPDDYETQIMESEMANEPPPAAPAVPVAAPAVADQPKCRRCGGRGYFGQFRHVQGGVCFGCGGSGFRGGRGNAR